MKIYTPPQYERSGIYQISCKRKLGDQIERTEYLDTNQEARFNSSPEAIHELNL